MNPSDLTPWAVSRLRSTVDDAGGFTQHEMSTAGREIRDEHPGWSDAQIELAALDKLARRNGIDW